MSKNNMNKISVIIPIFNAEKTLDRCLESVTQQTYKNLEIILIDDGSKDASKEKCYGWAKKDKRIKVIVQENSGVSAARNAGINIATGDYIAFVDSDDWLDLTMYEKLLCKATEEKADLTFCRFSRVYEYNMQNYEDDQGLESVVNEKKYEEFFTELPNNVMGVLWRVLFKKQILKELRLNEKLRVAEDLEFLLRCLNYAQKCSLVNECLYYYYICAPEKNRNKYFYNSWYIEDRINFGKELYKTLTKIGEKQLANGELYRIYLELFSELLKNTKIKLKSIKKLSKNEDLKKFNSKINYKIFKSRVKQRTIFQKIVMYLIHHNFFNLIRFGFLLCGKQYE